MIDHNAIVQKLRSLATVTEVDFSTTKYRAEQRAAAMREAADAIEDLVTRKALADAKIERLEKRLEECT